MPENAFDRRYLPQWLLGSGAILLLIFGCLWWTKVYEDPYNVYWGMLSNSLSTSSVTKRITQKNNGTTLDQYIALRFGPGGLAYGRTMLTNASGVVQTESVGTLNRDYIRYTRVNSNHKPDQKQAAKLLGKWAAAPVSNSADTNAATPFLLQSLLGLTGGNLVPIANLSATDRAMLLQQLHNNDIFDVSFGDVVRSKQHGRPIYTYDVKVQPVAYVGFEKAFAHVLGIKLLNSIDPNNYQNQQAAEVRLSVDVRSRQLVGIGFPGTQHAEKFSSYGVPVTTVVPTATISSKDLQTLVHGLQ